MIDYSAYLNLNNQYMDNDSYRIMHLEVGPIGLRQAELNYDENQKLSRDTQPDRCYLYGCQTVGMKLRINLPQIEFINIK